MCTHRFHGVLFSCCVALVGWFGFARLSKTARPDQRATGCNVTEASGHPPCLSIISIVPSCHLSLPLPLSCPALPCPVLFWLAVHCLFFPLSSSAGRAVSTTNQIPPVKLFESPDCCLVIHPEPLDRRPPESSSLRYLALVLVDPTCLGMCVYTPPTARLLAPTLALHINPPYCRPATPLVCLSGPPHGSTPETRIDVAPDICRCVGWTCQQTNLPTTDRSLQP